MRAFTAIDRALGAAYALVGAPWVLRQGSHVRVDLLVSNLPTGLARWLDKALDLVGCIICGLLIHYGWVSLSSAWMFQSMQHKYFVMPEWVLLSVFVSCFVLLFIEFLFRLIRGGAAPEAAMTEAKGL
ncbi:MAG: TRAP transporter small permease [Minwuia sp.]|nr:TRAP transporter small permease [Minwuia sp.]